MPNREVVIFVSILILVVAVVSTIFVYSVSPLVLFVIVALILGISFLSPRLVEFREYERGVMFRLGKFRNVAGPGWVLYWPAFENYSLTDLRVTSVDLPKQDVITRDDVEIKVDAIIYQKITSPKKAVVEIKDYKTALKELLRSQIRNTIGKMELEEVLEKTEEIRNELQATINQVAEEWGISVVKVEVQAIHLPPSLIEAMHRRREAGEYKTKLETEAQARQIALEILNKATSTLDDKTMSYLYMDSLKAIANGKATKIVLPLELTNVAKAISQKLSGPKEIDWATVIDALKPVKKTTN